MGAALAAHLAGRVALLLLAAIVLGALVGGGIAWLVLLVF